MMPDVSPAARWILLLPCCSFLLPMLYSLQRQYPPYKIMPQSPWWCSCHKPPSVPPLPAPQTHSRTNTHTHTYQAKSHCVILQFFLNAAVSIEINLQGQRLAPSYSVLMLSQITRQLSSPPGATKLLDWRARRRRRMGAKPYKLLSNWADKRW